MVAFQERLKELREKMKLSISQIAKELNINHSNISRWESGKQSPTVDNIIILVKFFGISAGYLLGVENEERYIDYADIN